MRVLCGELLSVQMLMFITRFDWCIFQALLISFTFLIKWPAFYTLFFLKKVNISDYLLQSSFSFSCGRIKLFLRVRAASESRSADVRVFQIFCDGEERQTICALLYRCHRKSIAFRSIEIHRFWVLRSKLTSSNSK